MQESTPPKCSKISNLESCKVSLAALKRQKMACRNQACQNVQRSSRSGALQSIFGRSERAGTVMLNAPDNGDISPAPGVSSARLFSNPGDSPASAAFGLALAWVGRERAGVIGDELREVSGVGAAIDFGKLQSTESGEPSARVVG